MSLHVSSQTKLTLLYITKDKNSYNLFIVNLQYGFPSTQQHYN